MIACIEIGDIVIVHQLFMTGEVYKTIGRVVDKDSRLFKIEYGVDKKTRWHSARTLDYPTQKQINDIKSVRGR